MKKIIKIEKINAHTYMVYLENESVEWSNFDIYAADGKVYKNKETKEEFRRYAGGNKTNEFYEIFSNRNKELFEVLSTEINDFFNILN